MGKEARVHVLDSWFLNSFLLQNKKAMRGNAWLKTSLFAPYDGITRIRFKGSSDLSDLSANGSPALAKDKTEQPQVNAELARPGRRQEES